MANKDFYYQKENVDGDIEYKKINLGTEGQLLSVTSEGDIGLANKVYQLQTNNSISPVSGNNDMNSASDTGTISGGTGNCISGRCSSIAGGTTNCIIGNYSTIPGGSTNCVSAGGSSIGGGSLNKVSGGGGTIGGGGSNNVNVSNGTIGGGSLNTVSGLFGTIGGGQGNFLNGYGSTVSGGGCNSTYGTFSVISGGCQNNISSSWAQFTSITGGLCNQIEAFTTGGSILGGTENKVSYGGVYGTILGGLQNTIDPNNHFGMASGWGAKVTNQGEEARSVGFFSEFGDAQVSNFILRSVIPIGSSQEYLKLYNINNMIYPFMIPSNVTWNYEIDVVGKRVGDVLETAGYKIKGVIESSDVETSILSQVQEVLHEDNPAWSCNLSLDNGALRIFCSDGDSAVETRWVAHVRVVQVANRTNYGSCCCC